MVLLAALGWALERFAGLHNAMYLIPVLAIALAIVLFAASRAMLKESDTNPN